MPKRVYIDGHAGTTGLRIREWLADRTDIDLLTPPDAERKSPEARQRLIAEADLAVLCLPDEAAREAAAWADHHDTRVLDASTAHRVGEGWVYGLPELEPGQRERIRVAPRVSNPGCYPTAFLLLVRPLVDAAIIASDSPLTIHALSGYSGGGRTMIERWEEPRNGLTALPFEAPYALDRVHKHIPEMIRHGRLEREPQFVPAVGAFACGMRVEVPLHGSLMASGTDGKQIWECLSARYRGEAYVRVLPIEEAAGGDELRLDPRACNDTNRIELRVIPHPSGHCLLVGVLDNLGKGASGAAIQNLNLMLGIDESEGLPA